MSHNAPALRIFAGQLGCRLAAIAVGIALFLPVAGCSDHVDYKVGIVTRSVRGTMTVEMDPVGGQPFIIVRKHNRTLIEGAGGYLYRVSAALVRPQDGQYTVEMEAETDVVELMFLARNHIPVNHRFQRTLGVRSYIYHVRLKRDPAWRESYYLLIRPILTEYIVEPRFRLKPSDQLFLGEWMDATEAAF